MQVAKTGKRRCSAKYEGIMESDENHLTDDTPAGWIEVGDDLMPYWTRDGRSIEEIWEDRNADQTGESEEIPF